MTVTLYGPDGRHFGWMLEGFVFDSGFQPLAFPEGDDLYSFSECRWVGTHNRVAVYDQKGGVVAIAPGRRAIRAIPARHGRLPPRIKPLATPLPEEHRLAFDSFSASNAEHWVGLSLTEWLGQQDS